MTNDAAAAEKSQVADLADLIPEKKALFDQAARNQGFKDIADLVRLVESAPKAPDKL